MTRRGHEHPAALLTDRDRAILERLAREDEGLYSWLGERRAQAALAAAVRPDGYGRYLFPNGELTFYLELDRATEPTKRVADKLASYQHALANDPQLRLCNILLVVPGRRRLASLVHLAPTGPPWSWATIDGDRYQLLPHSEELDERPLERLPLREREPRHLLEHCLGRHWKLTDDARWEATA
jgi:hypothetical protein